MKPLIVTEVLSEELSLNEGAVSATVSMLGQGDTVPFISRYRK